MLGADGSTGTERFVCLSTCVDRWTVGQVQVRGNKQGAPWPHAAKKSAKVLGVAIYSCSSTLLIHCVPKNCWHQLDVFIRRCHWLATYKLWCALNRNWKFAYKITGRPPYKEVGYEAVWISPLAWHLDSQVQRGLAPTPQVAHLENESN